MARYRKKPVIIEAIKYIGRGNFEKDVDDIGVPDWIWKALENKIIVSTNGTDPLIINTLEGYMTIGIGDWVIQGVQNEIYPCKPDIFDATYERVEE